MSSFVFLSSTLPREAALARAENPLSVSGMSLRSFLTFSAMHFVIAGKSFVMVPGAFSCRGNLSPMQMVSTPLEAPL